VKALWPLLWIALAAAACVAREARADDYTTDEWGRRFRVAFDPATQLRLGLLAGITGTSGAPQAATALETGLSVRTLGRSRKHGQEVRWQLDHRLVWGHLMPATPAAGGLRAFDASAYAGTWLRHADASYLVLPTEPPRNVYFPLDIGVDLEFGRFRAPPARPGDGEAPAVMRIGAARAAVLLDPIRSSRTGNSLEFGMGARYDLDLVGTGGLLHPVTVHRLAPFTATSLRWRWQDRRGLTHADAAASWYPHWSSDGRWTSRAAEARGRLQRVVVALNDEPIAVVLDSSYNLYPELRGVQADREFRVQAGLSVGVQLR
jgi:hypothetical protein